MKLNKQEQQALAVLENIVEAIKNPSDLPLDISEGEDSALLRTFGWSPRMTTTSKSDLESAVRGKEFPLLTITGFGVSGSYSRQCFFPFQVKARKPKKIDPEVKLRRELYLELQRQLSITVIRGGREEDIEHLVSLIRAGTAQC
ncbi:hypothetical protein [Vibrio aestuarianus]|uniref:hypothetical protein n=1 Tax=Vibrio aestuarianus TaxID=28171 RepID=UPI00237C9182|nr:hypothetical protein [Vibrio aestuarianus]MDE1328483.1 hypothetical protein [Vibrio aestuarianus]